MGSLGLLAALVLVALVVSTFKRSSGYEARVNELIEGGSLVGAPASAVDEAIGSHIRGLGDGVHTIDTREIKPWSALLVEVEIADGHVTRIEAREK